MDIIFESFEKFQVKQNFTLNQSIKESLETGRGNRNLPGLGRGSNSKKRFPNSSFLEGPPLIERRDFEAILQYFSGISLKGSLKLSVKLDSCL